jgi:transcriptional regulator GlxA family with amidase domain
MPCAISLPRNCAARRRAPSIPAVKLVSPELKDGVDKINLPGQTLADMQSIPRSTPRAVRVVELLAFPLVQLLDVTGPSQVFASANDLVVEAGGRPPYELKVVARGGAQVTASAGLKLSTAPLSPGGADVDTLIVAGGGGVEAAAADPEIIDWVQARAKRARRVASVCTGAFLLAASGLLDGRRAATHWSYCAELARRFPKVRVEPDPIFVCDGPVWSSAGVTAGIDLALALVEQDLGAKLALAVARYLVVLMKRPRGQAQFSTALSLQTADDKFGALHEWINKHLREPLSLSVLAAQARMSERSFSRHYAQATGVTPAHAIERLRVEAARQLLSESGQPVKRISQRCGFGSEETMRRSFLRLLAVTPQDYRTRFSA